MIALILFLSCPQDRAEKFFERVAFDRPEPSSDEERRVLEALTKKDHWVAAFRGVEEKAGPFADDLAVKVRFDWKGDEVAHAFTGSEGGTIRFNLKRLEEYQKTVDGLERQRRELEKKGKRTILRVPPARLDRMIWHELTHLLQRGYSSPDWFREGMAVWVSDDPNCLAAFAHAGGKIDLIETACASLNDTYARGHLFWMWLASRGAARKAIDASVHARKPWKTALEESTGLAWAELVAAELEWSAKELEKRRPPPK